MFERTELLIGNDNLIKLQSSKIALFGLGGVGGFAFEALVRAGVGEIHIFDNDTFDKTNLNRQILCTNDTIGKNKVDIAESRAKSINPNIKIVKYKMFVLPDNINNIDFTIFDYVIDAIDTITAKLEIIKKCNSLHIPIISCMGTGNKLDSTKLKITDISKTNYCKLAKVMRKLCKENNINHLTVLYSEEESRNIIVNDEKKHSPASISYLPAIAGLMLAEYVIKELICLEN
ncbi:MAG: ThiF family adenylyltransferase [Clostridia bacterium]|nr:ThiF family adenylyltransferase [Clostridia bacterium]